MRIDPIFGSSPVWYDMIDASDKELTITTVGTSDERQLFVAVDRKTLIYLTREQVGALIPLLQHFANTGELPKE